MYCYYFVVQIINRKVNSEHISVLQGSYTFSEHTVVTLMHYYLNTFVLLKKKISVTLRCFFSVCNKNAFFSDKSQSQGKRFLESYSEGQGFSCYKNGSNTFSLFWCFECITG